MCSVVSDSFAIRWTVAIGSSRQESWSGLPFPSPGSLPNPEIEPVSFASPTLAGGFFNLCTAWFPSVKQYLALVLKNLHANAGDIRDAGSIPGSGRSPGGGHGNPL